MARDPRILGPLALSALVHALAVAVLYLGARLSWPSPPIPIEIRRSHRTVERHGPTERRTPPPPAPTTTQPIAHTHGTRPARPRPLPPPETTDLAPFAPEDAHLVVLLRMDKLRRSPHRASVELLLGALPDWTTLVAGSDVAPLDDFDALLVATADPRDVTATFLAARYPDSPKVRALMERPLPDGDPRVFQTLSPGLSILTQPAELQPGDMGDARLQWQHELAKLDEVAKAPNGPAVLVTLADVPSLLRFGDGIPTPQALALATTADGSPLVRLKAAFASEAEAATMVQKWPEILGRYRTLTTFLGLGSALDGLQITRKEAEVEVTGRIPEAQLRLAFSWLEPLLPHRAPPSNLPP